MVHDRQISASWTRRLLPTILFLVIDTRVCMAQWCPSSPEEWYEIKKKNESPASVAKTVWHTDTIHIEKLGEETLSKSFLAWQVILADNYKYGYRCYVKKSCETVQLPRELIGMIEETPLWYDVGARNDDCQRSGGETTDTKCIVFPGDVLRLRKIPAPNIRTRNEFIKSEKKGETVIYAGESLGDLIRIRYPVTMMTNEKYRVYAFGLATRNMIGDPFVSQAHDTCLKEFPPFSVLYSEPGLELIGKSIRGNDIRALENAGVKVNIRANP